MFKFTLMIDNRGGTAIRESRKPQSCGRSRKSNLTPNVEVYSSCLQLYSFHILTPVIAPVSLSGLLISYVVHDFLKSQMLSKSAFIPVPYLSPPPDPKHMQCTEIFFFPLL